VTDLRRGNLTNLALFSARQSSLFAELAEAARVHLSPVHVVTVSAEGKAAVPARSTWRRPGVPVGFDNRSFDELGLLQVPISFREILRRLKVRLAGCGNGEGARLLLAVDMSWGLHTPSATANFASWMAVAEELASQPGVSVVSLYNRRLLIDEQLLAALRGHPGILTASGIVANPHWLPARLLMQGTLRQQVDHWLGAIAPALAEAPPTDIHAAEGADPMWLLRRSAEEPAANLDSHERWKIRCFGRLRIYRNDGSQVDWEVAGGATRKTKTLFAYLLQKGGHGASTEELSDLLWPEAENTEAARNRLYHTVKCLRDALEPGPAPNPARRGGRGRPSCILRDGSRYVLALPERSWLDIPTFEQLCRQSQGHIAAGAGDEALICLRAADRLYTGDLFEDIPSEYADDGERDWCWSKRYWLREMLFKVHRDAARIYRERKDYSAALAHCQKALAIDPLCEMAHEEAMHVFHAQGRREAVDRQYRLYVNSLTHFDDRPQSAALRSTYRSLVQVGSVSRVQPRP
jgi:two-component SAPR family response regulator